MYDIFIDEEKTEGYIGFLLTKNTPALQQILFNVREGQQNYGAEVKFSRINNNNIRVALQWLNVFFRNDFNIGFFYRKWNKTLSHKRNTIIKTIDQIKTITKSKNIVVFMDMDSNHKNVNLQNQIQKACKIPRCYHLDSKTFDMLQLSDILLQCAIKKEKWSFDKEKYKKLMRRMNKRVSMKKPELKKLLVFQAMKKSIFDNKIKKRVK